MKVEIWSDIACPFCYIGKHHFEKAVEAISENEFIDIEWKSFELDPHANLDYKDDLYSLLANKYGQTREWAMNSASGMKEKGKQLGLELNFDTTIPTNTFNAHRLIHMAKSKGLQGTAKEALFEAYFKDGRHIGDFNVLLKIGEEIGLKRHELSDMLYSDLFKSDVRSDEELGQQFGIKGVPFFVINRKYGISGAQPISYFIDTLQKTLQEDDNNN